MASAQQWAGVAEGLSRTQDYIRQLPEQKARRAEAQAKQGLAEEQLKDYRADTPTRRTQAELDLAQARADLRTANTANLKATTFDTFRRYDVDGDTRHLNTFLADAKKNPAGKNMWSHWVRFDPLTRNAETEAMLGQAGIADADAFFAKPELVKSKVLGTDQSGKRVLLDMNKLYAATGYTQHMTKLELEEMQQRAKIESLMRGGQSVESTMIAKIAKEEGITTLEAYEKYQQLKGVQSAESSVINKIAKEENLSTLEAFERYQQIKGSTKTTGTKVERVADDLMTEDPSLSRPEAIKQATMLTESRTATAKDLESAQTVRDSIDELSGGDFFSADLSDPAVRRKVGPKITELEGYTDKKLTTEDKRTIRQLRSLTALGGKAGGAITDAEAGPIDSMLRSVKKYVSNEIPGTAGTAAYETFRNVFRNALYGASLTSSETAAFTAAAGSLKQQTGPVLQQLLVQLEDVKEQLTSVYDMNDEYVAQYYIGRSREEIDEVVAALDERVEFFKSFTANEVRADEMRVSPKPLPPGERPSLDSIFGGE